jgi:hypothetical protein
LCLNLFCLLCDFNMIFLTRIRLEFNKEKREKIKELYFTNYLVLTLVFSKNEWKNFSNFSQYFPWIRTAHLLRFTVAVVSQWLLE